MAKQEAIKSQLRPAQAGTSSAHAGSGLKFKAELSSLSAQTKLMPLRYKKYGDGA
jgi:hypothetical protein